MNTSTRMISPVETISKYAAIKQTTENAKDISVFSDFFAATRTTVAIHAIAVTDVLSTVAAQVHSVNNLVIHAGLEVARDPAVFAGSVL